MNHRQSILAAFYKYAATYTIPGEDGHPTPLLVRAAPTLGMRYRQVKRRYRALSLEEMTKFFAVIPTDTVQGLRDRALFLVFFWTSRRRMEVLRLRWGDVEESVIVDPDGTRRTGTIYHFYGKGHKDEDDSAELPAPAKKALDTYLQASGRLATIQPEDALFPSFSRAPYARDPDPKQPICPQTVQAALKRYCRLAGIKPFGMHCFRHTSARERYAAGEDVRSIQKLLRHVSLATTDMYLSVLVGTADPFAKLLESKYAQFSG